MNIYEKLSPYQDVFPGITRTSRLPYFIAKNTQLKYSVYTF